jgi:hypothetical protein
MEKFSDMFHLGEQNTIICFRNLNYKKIVKSVKILSAKSLSISRIAAGDEHVISSMHTRTNIVMDLWNKRIMMYLPWKE